MGNKEPRYFKDMTPLEKVMAIVGIFMEIAMLVLLGVDILTDNNVTTILLGVLAMFWLSRAVMESARGRSGKTYLLLTGLTMLLDVIYVFQM